LPSTGTVLSEEALCTGSGLCVNVPVVPPGGQVETAGAIGGELTTQFSNTLEQIAQQLESIDEYDDYANLTQMITDLANKGHQIADLQGDMTQEFQEILLQMGADDSAINNFGMEFQGSSNIPDQLADELNPYLTAINGLNGLSSQLDQQLITFQNELQNYPDLVNNNPELFALIDLEVNQIKAIADGVGIDSNSPSAWETQFENVHSHFSLTTNASLTEQSANTVCNSGGSTSQCVSFTHQQAANASNN
jgi:hypothetical protein